jgi:biotin carboxyl carrier protein
VNFIAIQQSHSIACDGYRQFTVRTGYDQVIAHRSHDLFAYTAKKPGKVTAIDAKGLIVTYDDETQGYELGRRFGNAAGLVVPHEIVTPLKLGDEVQLGDVIVYNSGFFEPDFFNAKQVVLKNAINVKTVLWESTQTLEDASSISSRAAGLLTTNLTKVKTIVVNFDQTVNRLVKAGDTVQADSLLCIIEDAVTANNKLFDEQTLDTLRALSAQTPRANVNGVVEKIEVFYHGEKEDMSDSLRAICSAADKELKRKALSLNRKSFTGSVDGGFRIESDQLGLDSLAIRVYITAPVSAGVGDKGVFCNQMKTVFSEVLEKDYVTEEGQTIDAVFSVKSINARLVNSPFVIGTTNTLLEVLAKKAVAAYRGAPTP